MNPGAKVKLHGAQVGTVSHPSRTCPTGRPRFTSRSSRASWHLIPANVAVDIVATTVFGAKFVQAGPPGATHPPQHPAAGQVLDAESRHRRGQHVFQQLTSVLSKIDPSQTQRDARRDLHRRERPRQAARPDPRSTSMPFWPSSNPSLPNLEPRHRCRLPLPSTPTPMQRRI